MKGLVEVEPHELKAMAYAFLYNFCLMASYYIIQPLRDALGIAGGDDDLPILFALSLVVMLVANPVFASLVNRFPPRRFIPMVYRFFLVNLIGFYFLLKSYPKTQSIGQAFFLWVGIFNLFTISVLWGFVASVFDSKQGKRLFGFIGAGGTLGQFAGSGMTSGLASTLGAVNMLMISMVLLELSVWFVKALDSAAAEASGGKVLEEAKPKEPEQPAAGKPARAAPGLMDGVKAVLKSNYLLGICLYMFLYTFTSSFLYFGKASAVAANVANPGEGAAFFAKLNLAQSALTVIIQMFLTGRLMAGLGVTVALLLVPLWTVLGFAGIAIWPTLMVFAIFDVSRKTINYAVARPARELLYTVVSREEKYTSKSFIDTFIYRVGDASAAGMKYLLNMFFKPGKGATPEQELTAAKASAVVAVPFAMMWVACSWWLGRSQQRMSGEQEAAKSASIL